MPSGLKQLLINLQERALSGDINRLQSLSSQGWAEAFRYLLNAGGNDDLDAGALVTENAGLGTPMSAEVIGGLLVRPAVGSLGLTIDKGVLLGVSPDADPDASQYKFVADPGIPLVGTLNMTPGGSGLRVDIIECSISTTSIVETAVRDIYNTTTRVFNPTTVTKVQSGKLIYRVRQGTPGGPFPGPAIGWLPLCVASVPASATNNDAMTFWDVRPLLNDRAFGVANMTTDRSILNDTMINASQLNKVQGKVDAIINGRRVGGIMRRGSPGVDGDFIDFTDPANQEVNFRFLDGIPYLIYLSTPFGLPRWARYTDASSGARRPRSTRGIYLISIGNCRPNGQPGFGLSAPTGMGLGANGGNEFAIQTCFVVAAGMGKGGFTAHNKVCYVSINLNSSIQDLSVYRNYLIGRDSNLGAPLTDTTISIEPGGGTPNLDLIWNAPGNVVEMTFSIEAAHNATAGITGRTSILILGRDPTVSFNPATTGTWCFFEVATSRFYANISPPGYNMAGRVTIPIINPYPSTVMTQSVITQWTLRSESDNTATGNFLVRLESWKLG
jgi:hypothetical protein